MKLINKILFTIVFIFLFAIPYISFHYHNYNIFYSDSAINLAVEKCLSQAIPIEKPHYNCLIDSGCVIDYYEKENIYPSADICYQAVQEGINAVREYDKNKSFKEKYLFGFYYSYHNFPSLWVIAVLFLLMFGLVETKKHKLLNKRKVLKS